MLWLFLQNILHLQFCLKISATGDFEPGIKDLMKYGYIPADHGPESVASAMEYAIADWAISKLAEKLGVDPDDINKFSNWSCALG